MRAVSLFFVLLAFWLLMSGHYTTFLIGSGVISSALVVVVAGRKGALDLEGHPVHPVLTGALTYWPWLFWQIVLANLDVFYRVWHPRLPIDPRLVKVPYRTSTDLLTTLYANSITLTPGTITVAVEEDGMLIHCLSEKSEQSLLTGEMHDRVKKME